MPCWAAFSPFSLVTCICLILLFIFIILVIVSVISSGVRSYRGGGTIGSPRTGGGGPIIIPFPRTPSSGGIFGGGGTAQFSSQPFGRGRRTLWRAWLLLRLCLLCLCLRLRRRRSGGLQPQGI